MQSDEFKLDNPVFYSLIETHQQFTINHSGVAFYHPDYCPFGGVIDTEAIAENTLTCPSFLDNFYVVGHKPLYSDELSLINNLVCNQMLLQKPVEVEITEQLVKLETTTQKEELFNLVNLVQPGYFRKNTSALGNYYGIYKSGNLVAVTGERMKMDSYTEISAVVTHPAHTGNGYAKQLTAFTANQIFLEGKIPYLHVAETNKAAIALYEKIGFTTRRKISFWHFAKKV